MPEVPLPDPAARRVRALVVDDSALMRRLLTDVLGSSGLIEVVGVARNGREAVAQVAKLKPDVVTLDVEMPEVSGLDALPAILAVREVPVVMVSALTQEGADVTLKALELGAVDFHSKPTRNQLAELRAEGDLLVTKIVDAAHGRVFRPRKLTSRASAESPPRPRFPAPADNVACVAIGISTGGPQALARIIPLLRPPSPPIVIVQHMPAQFTGVFAQRLDRTSELEVKEAADGDLVMPNRVLIAPGGRHLTLTGRSTRVRASLSSPDAPSVSGHRPSVDVLFQSVARVYEGGALGVIMTGMGRDGVDGCRAILEAGGLTLGQDEATSVVYGMNKAAFLEGAVKHQFSLDDLPEILQELATPRSVGRESGGL
ncbi:chemotaxis response regulator protein-glutamate methylesterase [Planctomyces sp. SH-PL62]|uniref:protein-glutamate methylesterase/protein-glutamine glutaminase n=1 Tax=Planctomyces sp. SH-PL62 TaxID=1636152 RepID=UPI00078C1BA7|nr:chemotaxis response regulator protein-glutamate methylesterase [Planctomyces sp. SH-PL62]AMV39067.1 Chemotaxis response regulator protein-glutamate methylesterase [Planctomyces sp. SH-PL62]